MKNRVQELRKKLKMSQTAFGEKLGMSRDAINNLENNRAPLTELKAKAICAAFNVNYEWLIGDDGEMYKAMSREEELFQWLHGICDDGSDFERRFVSALARLGNAEWQVLEYMLDKIYAEDVLHKKEKSNPPKEPPSEQNTPSTETMGLTAEEMREIDKETELFRQHMILERMKKSTASSSIGSV